jgi:hypothetical protein
MDNGTDAQEFGAKYESVEGLSRVLVVMLLGAAAVDGVAVVSSAMQMDVLRETHGVGGAITGLYRENSIGALALALTVATIPVFALWIVRAHRNLLSLGARRLDVTPGWALGWFFIPFANLWKPYQAMRTLWRASYDSQRWHLQAVPWWVTLWWVTWIARQAMGVAMTTYEPAASAIEAQIHWTEENMTVQTVSGLLNGLAAMLVLRIWRAQSAQFRSSKRVPPAEPARPASRPRTA